MTEHVMLRENPMLRRSDDVITTSQRQRRHGTERHVGANGSRVVIAAGESSLSRPGYTTRGATGTSHTQGAVNGSSSSYSSGSADSHTADSSQSDRRSAGTTTGDPRGVLPSVVATKSSPQVRKNLPMTSHVHVVFDFFTSSPMWSSLYTLRAPGVPDETTHGSPDTYWNNVREIRENDHFLEGMLLKSLECEATLPYIHYIVYNNSTSNVNNNYNSSPPDRSRQDKSSRTKTTRTEKVPNHQLIDIVASQGGYREMFTFVDQETPILPKRPHNPHAAYIVSAFKANPSCPELDRSWSYWSGADLIVETVPAMLKLQRVTFHKVKYSACLDSFAYVLLCELGEALRHPHHALEFVGTLKDRQCGTSSLYVIEHSF